MPSPIGNAYVRPTRDEALMRHAQINAERSTCSRAHVGVVIAHEGRIVSQGYNGAPVGMPHCDHTCGCAARWASESNLTDIHSPGCPMFAPCLISVHAEANSIAFAAKYGIATAGAVLFTTMAPCLSCSQLIINAGIMRVVYGEPYRYNDGINLLLSAGIMAERG